MKEVYEGRGGGEGREEEDEGRKLSLVVGGE